MKPSLMNALKEILAKMNEVAAPGLGLEFIHQGIVTIPVQDINASGVEGEQEGDIFLSFIPPFTEQNNTEKECLKA